MLLWHAFFSFLQLRLPLSSPILTHWTQNFGASEHYFRKLIKKSNSVLPEQEQAARSCLLGLVSGFSVGFRCWTWCTSASPNLPSFLQGDFSQQLKGFAAWLSQSPKTELWLPSPPRETTFMVLAFSGLQRKLVLNGISHFARCVDRDPARKGATQQQRAAGTEPSPIHIAGSLRAGFSCLGNQLRANSSDPKPGSSSKLSLPLGWLQAVSGRGWNVTAIYLVSELLYF